MKDILAIIPHGNVKSELIKFFSQYQRDFFPIFPMCIPLAEVDFSKITLKELKSQFSSTKITLENLQIVDIWDEKNVAALSTKIHNFDNITFLANFDKNYFCPLGFFKSTSDSLEIDIKTDFKIDFKIFQLVHLRFEKQKSPKSANEPTLSFSYKILDSVWCK
jgi:hypothetical protein